jgi:hypothetical protein
VAALLLLPQVEASHPRPKAETELVPSSSTAVARCRPSEAKQSTRAAAAATARCRVIQLCMQLQGRVLPTAHHPAPLAPSSLLPAGQQTRLAKAS